MDNAKIGFIIILIVIFALIAVSVYYLISFQNKYETCRNSENVLCPTYYCPNTKDGKKTTLCNSSGTAFRHDENGALMCQKLTIQNNSVIQPYPNYTKPCEINNTC